MRRRSAALAAGGVLLLAVLAACRLPLRPLLLIALGRSWCPWRCAWLAHRNTAARRRLCSQLREAGRVVERDGRCVLWDFEGERYWAPEGCRVLPGMLAEQKLGLYGTAGQGVQPGDVVMDCGACLGLYTLRALSSGAARVIAIEPSPVNRECLRRNVEMHGGRDRVTIVPAGIWDRKAELRLRMQAGNPAADSVALTYRGSREGPLVDVGPIDDLVRELELRQLDWIKMDVEGAERAGLQGARETLRRFQPRLVVAMEHRFDDPREIPRLVASIADGYRCEPGPCVDVGNALRPAVITFR